MVITGRKYFSDEQFDYLQQSTISDSKVDYRLCGGSTCLTGNSKCTNAVVHLKNYDKMQLSDQTCNHGIKWNSNKNNHHPGTIRLQEIGERTLTRYLWGDENGNAILPTYKDIEDIRKSFEAVVKMYNHQLQEEYGQSFHLQTIKTLHFITKHVEPILYESMLHVYNDESYKSDWFAFSQNLQPQSL